MNRSPYNSTSNRSPSNSLPLRKAIIGFLNFKTAAGLSQRSVDSYQRILEQWADYARDKKVSQFTDHEINAYLVYMRTEYVPRRFGGDTRALSPKSLRNIWISLCAFFYLGTHRIQDGKPHEASAGTQIQGTRDRALYPGGD